MCTCKQIGEVNGSNTSMQNNNNDSGEKSKDPMFTEVLGRFQILMGFLDVPHSLSSHLILYFDFVFLNLGKML